MNAARGETYRTVVKVAFAKGAQLADPSRLFNSSLGGNIGKVIDFHEGETIKDSAFKSLSRNAEALNRSAGRE